MKRNRIFAATASVALIVAAASWRVAAQVQAPAGSDALAPWRYPSVVQAFPSVGFGNMPFRAYQAKTGDPVEKVYAFYENKAVLGATGGHSGRWNDLTQHTLVVNQPAGGGYEVSSLNTARPAPDDAVLVIHQPAQTVIVTISRDALDKSLADINIIADQH